MPTTPEEYLAKAADAKAQLAGATTDAERLRLKRAHGVYLKLANHGAEAAQRAALRRTAPIVPERQMTEPVELAEG